MRPAKLSGEAFFEVKKQDQIPFEVHTPHYNVVVIVANMFNTEETCVSYVAATRARHLLIWMDTKLVKRKSYAYNKPRTKELNWE